MENTLTSMVYFASPAARKTFGRAKLSGQISIAQMENVCKSCTVIANASPDSEKHPTIGRTRINNVMSVKHIPPYASPNSFLLYHSPALFPRHQCSVRSLSPSQARSQSPEYWQTRQYCLPRHLRRSQPFQTLPSG